MKSVNKIQIAVIAGSILLVVLLLFANTKLPLKEEAAETDQHDHANEGVNILDFVGTHTWRLFFGRQNRKRQG